MTRDKRYGSSRWRRTARAVLLRDGYRCWIIGCPRTAKAADHIEPVYPGMPDSLFYGMTNLRASCTPHNTARGVAAALERDTERGVAPIQSASVFGGGVRSLKRGYGNDRPLARIHTQATIFGDRTRKPETHGAA